MGASLRRRYVVHIRKQAFGIAIVMLYRYFNRYAVFFAGNIYGSYVHGIFDKGTIAATIVKELAKYKGIDWEEKEQFDYAKFKEEQYDLLAKTMREHMDMEALYRIIGVER